MARQTEEEAQDNSRNPGEEHARQLFGEGSTQDSTESIRDKELKGTWKDNVSKDKVNDAPKSEYGGKPAEAGRVLSANNVRAVLKKRGPLGLIAIIGLTGGIFGTLLFSPGLLFIQMKEALLDRFNYQLASFDTRSNMMLDKKIGRAFTAGVCAGSVNIKCKFATISEKQAARMKAAGIDIEEGSSKFGNRVKPTRVSFNGQTMDASEFMKRYKTDLTLRTAMRSSFNPKFASWTDRVWNSVAKKIGVVKGKNLPKGSAADKAAAVDENVKNGTKLSVVDDGVVCDDKECRDKNGNKLNENDSKAARAAKAAGVELLEEAAETTGKTAAEAIEKTSKAVAGTATNAVANFIKVTGPVDIACQAYTGVRALGFAAKTVRAIQLARYVMIFLNVADQIVAGTADQEDVAYLGGVLTNVAIDAASGLKRKAAMDSMGMQFAMYGTYGGTNSYASQFLAGGGLTGDLIMITDYINANLGGSPLATCKTLSNGWVQAGSIAAGIALLLIPGANVAFTAADIAKGIGSVALSVALLVLPEMLKEIVAGNVVKGIVGEDSGNAIAAGAGTLMGTMAQNGGNAPLKLDDAMEYTNLQTQVVASYAADERATLSPLDASNPNTFLGTVLTKLMPYTSQTNTLSGTLSTTASIFGSALSALTPKSSALSDDQMRKAYTACGDTDYSTLEVATTPLCTPIFGIPPEYLGRDIDQVIDDLVSAGDLDLESGLPKNNYLTFIQNCMERNAPLGDSGQDLQGSDGSECFIDSVLKADYYLFYIDGRVDAAMDGPVDSTSSGNESKQELAKKIIAKGKVTYWAGGNIKPTLEQIADGTVDGDSEPCGININILKIIDAITDSHTIEINDLNRQCTNSVPSGSSKASRHYAGNGSAIDIGRIDGQFTLGRNGPSQIAIALAMPILSEAATSVGSFSQIGQVGCTGSSISIQSGIIQIKDACSHLHLDVPPTSDPSLKHAMPGGF